jgi:hypothetical protein
MKRKSRQQITKLSEKECYFCKENEYKLLDVHRIYEGKEGGTYHPLNTIVVCCKCHRKIHAGIIKTIKKHLSTSGRYVLHYYENGEEKWK